MRRLADPINLAALGFALSLLVVWQLLADAQLVSPIFFPPPLRALDVLQRRLTEGSLWLPLVATSLRMIAGWLLASAIGIVLGAAIGSSSLARDLLNPTLEFIRPLPASAVIPVAILFLGLSNAMSVTVVAFGAIWPVLLASVHGFSSVSSELTNVSRVLGLSRWDFLRKIAFPSALPDIVAGLRVSLAVALILAVVTEMQSSLAGLGWEIFSAQRFYRSADLYAGLVLLAVLGFIANQLILFLERRVLRWRNLST